MLVKFELRSFNRFNAVRTDTHTHTHTLNENSISAIHSVHLAEIIIERVVKSGLTDNVFLLISILS